MKSKYSPSFERDWYFYSKSSEIFTFCGKPDQEIWDKISTDKEFGHSAKDSFLELDSSGKIIGCSEPELLFLVLRTKAAVNWQIKQWAEMLSTGVLFLSEFSECKTMYELPDWVIDSTLKQANKFSKSKS